MKGTGKLNAKRLAEISAFVHGAANRVGTRESFEAAERVDFMQKAWARIHLPKPVRQPHSAENIPLAGCIYPPKADPKTIERRSAMNKKILDAIPVRHRCGD